MGAGIGFLGSVGLPSVAQDSLSRPKDSGDAVFHFYPESGNISLGNPDLSPLDFETAKQIYSVHLAVISAAIGILTAEKYGRLPGTPKYLS